MKFFPMMMRSNLDNKKREEENQGEINWQLKKF